MDNPQYQKRLDRMLTHVDLYWDWLMAITLPFVDNRNRVFGFEIAEQLKAHRIGLIDDPVW